MIETRPKNYKCCISLNKLVWNFYKLTLCITKKIVYIGQYSFEITKNTLKIKIRIFIKSTNWCLGKLKLL